MSARHVVSRGLVMLTGLIPLLGPASASAQTAPTLAAPPQERVILLSALVRDARIAQRDCDIVAKRAALGGIQMAMREIRSSLRRDALQIAVDVRHLRRDGVDLATLEQIRAAADAAELVNRRIAAAGTPQLRTRLETLRNRYADFDQWEILYAGMTRMLARLDGVPGDCKARAETPPVERLGASCPPEAFEPCRYGRPVGGGTAGLVVAVPVQRR